MCVCMHREKEKEEREGRELVLGLIPVSVFLFEAQSQVCSEKACIHEFMCTRGCFVAFEFCLSQLIFAN
jgi:hypothetical protein